MHRLCLPVTWRDGCPSSVCYTSESEIVRIRQWHKSWTEGIKIRASQRAGARKAWKVDMLVWLASLNNQMRNTYIMYEHNISNLEFRIQSSSGVGDW